MSLGHALRPGRAACPRNRADALWRGAPMNRNHPELIATRRAIALGKLTAFGDQCWRLAVLVEDGIVTIAAAVDTLHEADTANALSCTFGTDFLQEIFSDAFGAREGGAS